MERVFYRLSPTLNDRANHLIDAGVYASIASVAREGVREVARDPATETADWSNSTVSERRCVRLTPEMIAAIERIADADNLYSSRSDLLRDATHRVVVNACELQYFPEDMEVRRHVR